MSVLVNQTGQEDNRTKAAIGSLLFHAALLMLLVFYTFAAPEAIDEPTAIVLDFGGGGGDNAAAGEPDKGMNDDYTPPGEEMEPVASVPAATTPTPAPTPSKPQASTPPPSSTPTTTDADVAAIRQQKEADRQREADRQAEATRQRQAAEAAEAAKRAEQERRDRVKNNAGSAFGKPGSSGQGAGGGGKPGNGGINGGTGDNPFGKSSGTGGGSGGGDGTGTGASIGGGLGGRAVVKRGSVVDNSQKRGKVVIEVCVDKSGNITSASYTQKGSTTTDSELKSKALQAAKGYRFASSTADQQCGTITFDFQLK